MKFYEEKQKEKKQEYWRNLQENVNQGFDALIYSKKTKKPKRKDDGQHLKT